jgi:hypothetical protein
VHYLSFVVFVAAAAHAILAGTDASRPWAVALYGTPLAVVGALLAYRVVGASRGVAA